MAQSASDGRWQDRLQPRASQDAWVTVRCLFDLPATGRDRNTARLRTFLGARRRGIAFGPLLDGAEEAQRKREKR